jgi:AcrR family transcriptional regulator
MVRLYLTDCGGQYTTVWCGIMTKRLTVQDWIDFTLTTLAREGFDALKADVLARKLGVSRGSFYWHFSDLGTFHVRVIEHWRQMATEAIIADLERHESREERLDALLRRGFGHDTVLEIRMRAWADNNAEAARALRNIDRRRREYIERLLVEAGIPPPLAATRAQLLYWTYLGAALSQSRLTGEQLNRMVAELKQIGLGGPPGPPAAIEDSHQRRLSRGQRG